MQLCSCDSMLYNDDDDNDDVLTLISLLSLPHSFVWYTKVAHI